MHREMHFKHVMIPALDPDQESDFYIFSDSGSGFGSTEKQNQKHLYDGMIPPRNPDTVRFSAFFRIRIAKRIH